MKADGNTGYHRIPGGRGGVAMYEYLAILVLFGIPALAAIVAGIYFRHEDQKKQSKHA